MYVCVSFLLSAQNVRKTPPYPQVGDSKEPVRKGVRSLFRELCSFYPPAKLFAFLIDGLKSKNARQRTGRLTHKPHMSYILF